MSSVSLSKDGAVAILRLENPSKLNAFTPDMLVELEVHCATLERDREVRCVILAAAPARAFCAGADIAAWSGLSPFDFARHWVREGHRVFDRLARLSHPTIAALDAPAFGGGLELISCCDIRVLSENVHLSLPEAQVGIVPGWSGTQRLARLLPESVLKEMAVFGRRLTAERAYALGFAAEISRRPEETAREIAQHACSHSPSATEIIKYQIHAGVSEGGAAMIEALGGGMIAASSDKKIGVDAFANKRKPEFDGQ